MAGSCRAVRVAPATEETRVHSCPLDNVICLGDSCRVVVASTDVAIHLGIRGIIGIGRTVDSRSA